MLLILCQLGSTALIAMAFYVPVLTRTSLDTRVFLWTTCETKNGVESCGSNRESSMVCSELDSRTRSMIAFALIWTVNNALTIVVLLWEATGRPSPIRRLPLMVIAWSVIAGLIVVGINVTTLLANMCNNPLNYSELGGSVGVGAYFLCGAIGANILPAIWYLASPTDEAREQAILRNKILKQDKK